MIKINNWDKKFDPGEIISFEFNDPDSAVPTLNNYCVGVKFLGGDSGNPNNWALDHVNYWDTDSDPTLKLEPQPILQEEFEELLKKHQTKFKELLTQLIEGLSNDGEI